MTAVRTPPQKHHYVPEFLIKKWSDRSGMVRCWIPNPRGIKRYRKFPSQLGFIKGLYDSISINGNVLCIETDLMQRIDCETAKILNDESWLYKIDDEEIRSAIAVFIMTMLYRHFDDYVLSRESMTLAMRDPSSDLMAWYKGTKKPDWPEHPVDFLLAANPHYLQKAWYDHVFHAAQSEKIGTYLVNIIWAVRELKAVGPDLLIGDRPVVMSDGILAPNGHIAIALSPQTLLTLAKDSHIANGLARTSDKHLVTMYNQEVVGLATRFVVSTTFDHSRFVENRFSQLRHRQSVAMQVANAMKAKAQ